ncbi:hypothetical protein IAE22_30625, partial [Bacillus sp. S34]|nr:hypothetical protein [Bacillus sp. S34]
MPTVDYLYGLRPGQEHTVPLGKGVLKIMSKMGISTVSSYAGAQAFEAVGLSQEFVDRYFTGTSSIRVPSSSTSGRPTVCSAGTQTVSCPICARASDPIR